MFFLLLLLTLTACGEPPTVCSDFSGDFTVRYGDTDCRGKLDKNGGELSIVMTGPCTVEGMTFTYRESSLSVGFGGHSAETTADYLPSCSIPSCLHSALPYLPQAEYIETADGEDRFSLPTPSGSAVITASDGIIKTLTVPQNGLEFRFG